MSYIRSRKHAVNPYLAALAALAVAAPVAAVAQEHGDHHKGGHHDKRDHRHGDEDEMVIRGQREGFKVSATSSDKRTQPLLNTPQTVTVITAEVIDQQNATTLIDALRNTPGITMQLGENGNTSAGDTIQMRGFAAQTSLFLDGIRDLGAVSRDTFNIGQIEVAKGSAGSEFGRGASSGYINLVSKLPHLGGGSSAQASLYSEGGNRASADVDFRTGRTSALRLNAFTQDIDTAGRDYVNRSGWGFAPSWGVGIGTDTRFYVFGQVIEQNNVPDGGIPTIGLDGYSNASTDNGATLSAAKRVNTENFYGSVSDYEDTSASMLTGKIEHDFSENLRLTNLIRYGTSNINRVLTGVNTGATGITTPDQTDPATWTVNRSRQGVDQENTILTNQTNLRSTLSLAGIEHQLSGGLEFTYESQLTRTRAASGTTTPANLYNPNPNDAMASLVYTGAESDGSTVTAALYLFDTAKLNEQWLLNGGLRIDGYSIKTNATPATGGAAIRPLEDQGTVVSWNVGAVYKPIPNASLYAAIGTSVTPPGSANHTLNANATNVANPNFDPQETSNLEFGAKWDLFGARLALTAAWYSTKHKNEIVEDIDPGTGVTAVQFGERKVEGVELGVVGKITSKWQVIAGLQTMKTEITEGLATGNNGTGAAARWSPDLTASLWSTYQVTPKFIVGFGGNYSSEQLRVVAPGAAPGTGLPEIPAYFVANAMAAYDISERLKLQLNINNLFDEDYISSLNNGGGRVLIGAPQNAVLSLAVKF